VSLEVSLSIFQALWWSWVIGSGLAVSLRDSSAAEGASIIESRMK
jgi:hypothetical protein